MHRPKYGIRHIPTTIEKNTLLYIILISCIFWSCQKEDKVMEIVDEPSVHIIEDVDSEMNNAILQAQKSLFKFKEAITSNHPGYYNFALKQRFNTEDGHGEHIWISEIQYHADKYFGIVDNNPISTQEVRLGDTIEIRFQNITDWMFFDKDILRGAYTTKVLRKRMSPEERAKMKQESGMTFENEQE